MTTTEWAGYEFNIHKPPVHWRAVGGLYVFAYACSDWRGSEFWHALYGGQTYSLADRLPSHERWPEAVQLGATHIHARAESDEGTRLWIEEQLIEIFQPPLNIQSR